ncbi:DExH-box ATP-dependent RNA helicase DExH2, partial [Clarias magur]
GGRFPVAVVEGDGGGGRSSERCFSTRPERARSVAERAPAQRGGDLGQGFGDLPVHPAGSRHTTTTATSAFE